MVVSRRIRVCDFAALEFGRELDLIAFGKADNGVELLSQLGILAGEDMKQLMADEFFQVLLALAQFALWEAR